MSSTHSSLYCCISPSGYTPFGNSFVRATRGGSDCWTLVFFFGFFFFFFFLAPSPVGLDVNNWLAKSCYCDVPPPAAAVGSSSLLSSFSSASGCTFLASSTGAANGSSAVIVVVVVVMDYVDFSDHFRAELPWREMISFYLLLFHYIMDEKERKEKL